MERTLCLRSSGTTRAALRGVHLGILAAAAAGLLAQAVPPPAVPTGLEPPSGALVAPGKAPDFTILATGDVIGFLDPCG